MKLSILASGSGGNALYIEAEGTRVLVDAGLPLKELGRRLAYVPGAPPPTRMDALLVTHEHSDHGGHAGTLCGKGVKTYATAGTLRALDISEGSETIQGRFTVGSLEVEPVPLPHDAAEPVGFVVAHGKQRLGILTDCGHPTLAVARAYAGCDALVLETNHDPEMLRYGTYPPSLKRRIAGQKGHLSNEQAAELLRKMGGPAPRLIILAHLSQMCNRQVLARAAVMKALDRMERRRHVRLLVASQTRVLPPITISPLGIEIAEGLPGEQLMLRLDASAGAEGRDANRES